MKIADELTDFVSNAAKISSSGGVSSSLKALQYADDVKELNKFALLSAKFTDKASAVIKILGKNAIKLGKLSYLVISVLISIAVWLIGCLWFVYASIRTVRLIIIRKKSRIAHEAQ